MTPGQASSILRGVASELTSLPGTKFFKKVDSTLRGNPGVELAVISEELNVEKVLICPAFPQQGRAVREGKLLIRGRLLEETEFADKNGVSDVKSFFKACSPCRSLSLDMVRSGVDAVAVCLQHTGYTVADAETDADLRILAEAGKKSGISLYCGSGGLGRALAECEPGRGADRVPPRFQGVILVAAGSRNRATLEQCITLEEMGIEVVWIDGTDDSEKIMSGLRIGILAGEMKAAAFCTAKMRYMPNSEQQIQAFLGNIISQIQESIPIGGFILTGGDTASAVCRALHCSAIDLAGEVQPGLGWGVLVDGARPGLPVVTKAGGFGERDALKLALYFLLQETSSSRA